ncbi:NAD(P)-dependent oxidoreductase [uncultured Paraglaciecola sp.]|uniref:NAD(P)-dependent oxidoreductase n=1 Tax=uncultured Paraglaciecola sp. TaxID=1765024 RepID=UPI0030D88E7E|tara:strand:+ start:103970 stop:105304 length:1335 start_codon:yes stop_codon:yes gene_type:complete
MSTTGTVTIDDINAGFADLHKPYNKSQALLEASRCTYCYDAPCIKACPTGIDIPTFIHQIRTQNVKGAAKTILSENIMGGTCARACPTEVLCERACVRHHDQGKPVEIGLLQRYAVDHLLESTDEHPFVRAAETGKNIAVVGAGPAGLSCAHRAALLGHKVTVFEAKTKPGGLNEYGLAAYKMVDDFAQKEVDFLLGIGGIEIIYEQYLGKNLSLDTLRSEYDAVFLSIGLGLCNKLGLEGENLSGVYDALDFIEQLRQTTDKSTMPVGQNVVVIGGGNTAIDAAIQAKRLGAKKVTLAYRRSEENMTATDWEIELARKNGVDVRLWLSPVKLSGEAHISTITFEQTAIEAGRLVGTGVREQISTDMVLKAVGQKLDASVLSGMLIEHGKIKINDKYQTSIPGVYAGGDCIDTGEDLTVQSVEDGKRAAHAMGHTLFGIDFKEV